MEETTNPSQFSLQKKKINIVFKALRGKDTIEFVCPNIGLIGTTISIENGDYRSR